MTGRNPWVVLGVTEDSPYHEVQRAFRRRVKQTHPDSGGDAGEFATVVQAFGVVRGPLASPRRRTPPRPTPYDGWLRPSRPTNAWTGVNDVAPFTPGPSARSWTPSAMTSAGSDFSTVLLGEMTRARAEAACR